MSEKETLPKLQIVGYKNSGKTTLAKKIIQSLTEREWKVAAWKHHGHGGPPDVVEGTDSLLHQQAGAQVAGVEGAGTFLLSLNNLKQEDILAIYEKLPIDVLIIEGYKKLPFPKIVLVRKKQDMDVLCQLSNVQAIISWEKNLPIDRNIPVFLINEEQKYLPWIINQIGGERYE